MGKLLNRKSFTIVEIIIAVVIVGILSAVTVPIINGVIIKAKLAEMYTNIVKIEQEIRLTMIEKEWGNNIAGVTPLLHPLNERLYKDIGLKDGWICSGNFTYVVGYDSSGYFQINVSAVEGEPYKKGVCAVNVYEDKSKNYWMKGQHPWGQYVQKY